MSVRELKLSKELEKKALENLREDENLRSQALVQFKDWIEKHPRIKKCRMDDFFLLKFLRTKKFSVQGALELLENYLSTRKVLPQLFENLSMDDRAVRAFLSEGMIVITPEPDKHGRLVVSYYPEKYDATKFTISDGLRAMNTISEIASIDPRSQINGMVHIFDWEKFSMALVKIYTVPDMRNFVRCLQKTLPLRQGCIINVNMPVYCEAIFKVILSFFSDKLKERVKIFNNWDDVRAEVGASCLPQENGGKIPRADMAKRMVELAEKYRDEISSLNDYDIEVSDKYVNFGNEHDADLDAAIVGSFRTINVD